MLHFYQLLTSIGTMAFFFTVLWTLHMDIKLLNSASKDVRKRTDLSLLTISDQFRSNLKSAGGNFSCNNGSEQTSQAQAVASFTVVLNITDIKATKTDANKMRTAGYNETSGTYWTAYKKSLEKEETINSYSFDFNLYPGNICSDDRVYLLIYVHSAPDNYKRRMIIRNTWGNPYNIPLLKLKVPYISIY